MNSFRVLTFNMQFGQMWQEEDSDAAPVRLDYTIEFLHSCKADVWLLQEVEDAQRISSQSPVSANYLALKTAFPRLHSYFCPPNLEEPQLPFGIGLAIFSTDPLFEPMHYLLPGPPVTFEFAGELVRPAARSLICAKTRIRGRVLQLFNTHLQAMFMIGANSNEHRLQRDLVEKQLRWPMFPAILGGDMNCSGTETTVQQFESAGYLAVQKSLPTWKRRPYVLDHLFYNTHLSLQSFQVLETNASDHHGVVAEFEFLNPR